MRRVITEQEVDSFQDRGLGRGVDATNPTPWLNKRALQIRKVNFDDIIGTEEGNLYQGFVNEVESTEHFQTSLSASVPANQLVSLGIDSELSRSYSVSQKSVGKKIITRTISFQANFDGSSDVKPFEQRLSNWILQQHDVKKEEDEFKQEQKNASKSDQGTYTGGKKQSDEPDQVGGKQSDESVKEGQKQSDGKNWIKIVGGDKEIVGGVKEFTAEKCFELCYDFISTFSVTHYVHSLELGASEYRVMSLEEYSTKFRS